MIHWERAAYRCLRTVGLEGIKNKILAFAWTATLVPSLGMAWVSYRQNTNALTEKIDDELAAVATQAAREMDLWLTEAQYDVRVLASSYELSENLERLSHTPAGTPADRPSASRVSDYLNSVRQIMADYARLEVVDEHGNLLAVSGDGDAVPWPGRWMDGLRAGLPVLGDPQRDDVTGRTTIAIAAPVRAANDGLLGALAATVSFDAVEEIIGRFAPGEAGRAYLLQASGAVLASVRGGAADAATLPGDATASLFDNAGSTVQYVDGDGRRVLGTLHRIPRLDWAVVAEVPRKDAYAAIAGLRNLTIMMVAGLLLVVGAIAYGLALLIVRPLDRLTRGAAGVAAGDLAVDLPVVGGGEVAYLTSVFNDMVTKLRDGSEELRRKNEELETLSVTDSLTGLYNRRHLMDALDSELRRSRRKRYAMALLMIDVDHFKQYNDTHGHPAGDDALVRVAETLRTTLRETDTPARYGGEEFVVLLPESDKHGAAVAAERFREALEHQAFVGGSVTVSIGIADFPADGDQPEEVIARADEALYLAKRAGRNRIVLAGTRPEISAKTA